MASITGNMVTIVGAGTATITATQPGDDNYNAAQVAQADLTVNQAIQTIAFNALDPKTYGDAPFDLTATASSGIAVSFTSSDTTVAIVNGNTVTILKADTVVITASQAGNGNYNPATSVPQGLVINKATLTVIPDNKTIVYGDALPAFTFTYSGFVGSDDASAIDVLPMAGTRIIEGRIDGGGVEVIGAPREIDLAPRDIPTTVVSPPQFLKADDYYIVPFSGSDDNYAFNYDWWGLLTINKASLQAVADDKTKYVGEVNPELTISYSGFKGTEDVTHFNAAPSASTTADMSSLEGNYPISLSGGVAINYDFVLVNGTLAVIKKGQAITFDTLASKTYGDSTFNLTATAGSGLPVTFSSSDVSVATVSDSTVTILKPGTNIITASQVGDDFYAAAPDVQQTLVVNKASQTIFFDSLQSKTYGDSTFYLTASSSVGLPVSFASSDESVAAISGNAVTILSGGTTVITATQDGDDYYLGAPVVEQTLTVNPTTQTITFDSLAAKTYGEAPFDLTASASSGLAITYTSSDEAVAAINGSTLTIQQAGETVITASQNGNASYLPAADMQQTLTVNKATQVITFAALPVKVLGDLPFDLTATSSSGLAVAYTSSNTLFATVSGSTVTILNAGITVITARQAGNVNYLKADSVQQTLTIVKPSYVTNPGDGTGGHPIALKVTAAAQGGATTFTIELSPDANFNSGVISKSGLRTQDFSLSYNTVYYARVKTDLSPYGKRTSFKTVDPLSLTYVMTWKNGGTNTVPSATVTANPVPGATSYTIELNTDINFLTGVSYKIAASTNFMSFTGLTPGTLYHTRVQTDVVPGQWGAIKSFTSKGKAPAARATADVILEEDILAPGSLYARAYPNPFQNKLMVHIRSLETEAITIHLYDLNGKEAVRYEGKTNSLIELETGGMASGMYVMKVTTTEGMVVKKVIRE